MVKRPGRDQREGDEDNEDTAERFRVDRVFVPARSSSAGLPGVAPDPFPPGRTRPTTTTPPIAGEDVEVTLRRQLSKLQHQLSDAQRELASKGEELTAEIEHRLLITAARDKLLADLEHVERRVHQAAAVEDQVLALEQRLAEGIERYEQLAEMVDREHTGREAAEAQVAALSTAFDEARIKRIEERAQLEEQHASELERAEEQTRATLAAAEATFQAVLVEQREAHHAAVAEMAETRERELAALRGVLEPHVEEARTLAAEREREVEAVRAASERALVEQRQAHEREVARLAETHTGELATKARAHAAELTKALGERDVEILEHQQTMRRAEVRELQWEQSTLALRDQLKQLQNQVAAGVERAKLLGAEKAAVEADLAKVIAMNTALADESDALRSQLDARERDVHRAEQQRQRLIEWLRDGVRVLDGPVFEDTTADLSPVEPAPLPPPIDPPDPSEK